jgi:DtxR family Mn-dependent transcriptional regulator
LVDRSDNHILPEQKIEEILEAVWVAEECHELTLEGVRRECAEDVSDADLNVLVAEGLIARDGDKVRFTPAGRERGETIIRRHRLTESLLVNVLNLPLKKAHDIACDMEHILPIEMTKSICTLLGHPDVTPDGRPIPPGEDCLSNQTSTGAVIVNLRELKAGERGRVAYIKPKTHQRGHQLATFGLVPGVVVELHQRYPAYCIRFANTEVALDEDVAGDIYVSRNGRG